MTNLSKYSNIPTFKSLWLDRSRLFESQPLGVTTMTPEQPGADDHLYSRSRDWSGTV